MLIIGNKPYIKLPIGGLIDEFEENCRCGMAIVTPEYNNGSKLSHLFLCNHSYERLYNRPVNREDFLTYYNDSSRESDYLEKFWDFFQENKHHYKGIYYSHTHLVGQWNQMLKEWGCPYRFTKTPRTGMSVIFESLFRQLKVFVIGFSLYDDLRRGWGSIYKDGYDENNSCHSRDDEINILLWLHNNGRLDVTLCMLEDTETPTLRCENIKPTPDSLCLLNKVYGNVVIGE